MTDTDTPRDFIRTRVTEDVERGHRGGQVATRFPPEPNGYLHIGHAKSICLNFGVAEEFGGTCNLRYDDTNPLTESPEYAESIARDIEWLGFSWDEKHYASDYFERLYELAEELTRKGLAYVDFSSEEKIRKMRGTVSEPGAPSDDRERSPEENLALFRKMRAGEMADGEAVLRAKIVLAHPNMKMRDPLLYRIRHAHHYRTGEDWPIYPMYDWAHGLSDWIEGITHSLCTLEFENNRELYDWILHALELDDLPQQIEFARLNLSYTVLSKRKLLELVRDGHVDGWDDPRMPTLSGLRKRGVTPEAIRDLCERVGVAKANSIVDLAQLEHAIRNDLNYRAPRVLGVLRPLKVVIENWPEEQVDDLDAPYWPHDIPKDGSRTIPFTREIYIERDDFHRDPPAKYRRLAPGREVRLRYGYLIRATDFVEDDNGEVVEVHATYDPETRGGNAPDGRKVSGTIHWVSAERSIPATVRLYDRLFRVPAPDRSDDGRPFTDFLNPDSLTVIEGARLEASLAEAEPGSRFQFERHGYFYLDPDDSSSESQVWNQVVTLRDSWARITAAEAEAKPEAPAEAKEKASQKLVEMPTAPAPRPFDPDQDLDAAERSRYDRYLGSGLDSDDARVLSQADDADRLAAFFAASVEAGGAPGSLANWLVNDLLRVLKGRGWDDLALTPNALAELSSLADDDTISSATAGELFEELVADGGSPRTLVEERGLQQVSDEGELAAAVARVLAAHPGEAERFRGGEAKLTGFFVGQVMRETGGTADPQKVRELLGREGGK
jgi:glutaminyl-tRNA synthetase